MEYETIIEMDNVTLQDCLDLFEKKNTHTEIDNGKITNFVKGDC